MVARITPGDAIIFGGRQGPIQLNKKMIASGVEIQWGRRRINEAPINRGLSMKIHDPRIIARIRNLMPTRIYCELRDNGTEFGVFDGIIDKLTIRNIGNKPTVIIHATENFSWWSAWQRTIKMEENWLGWSKTHIETEINKELAKQESVFTPGQSVTRFTWEAPLISAIKGPIEGSIQVILETCAKSHPLAYPAWSPEADVLAATTHTPETKASNITTIPSRQISFDKSLTITAASQIGTVSWSWAGELGQENGKKIALVPGVTAFELRRGNTLDLSTPLGRLTRISQTTFEQHLTPALNLIAAQITPPREITISTARTPTLPRELLTPWEHGQTIKITGDPIAQMLTEPSEVLFCP